ncbi:hypothetical protein H072_5344 [Dactylellina haptotyla CBS 200.50]|uniref:CID domain-containing protein n=1 Tax=Dactylellina haptotyla (strain CBS 200.50) TaxID=1284197 RepID=S8ACQ5_DACHA|nr:hypothetical protein H072_5344 [Dactylellina haptotyla CBS 200.50]
MSFTDEVPSPAELAEDYKSSLEDLSVNSRWEITNLTVIAKENIHAAQAISKVIEEHIQKTSPLRKLPALYLLDSIAKNVGTPYTLFFGKNLYRTFMDSYSLVEGPVRRKLEEMLQTWKQPVPGATSSNPLFPAETTRKIDNALIKARTAAVQQQQKQMKQDTARFGIVQPSVTASANAVQYRSTPTPPTLVNGHGQPGPYGPPPSQTFDARTENRGTPQPPAQEPTPLPNLSQANYQQLAAHLGLNAPNLLANTPTTDALLSDIRPLIATTQARFAENPWDAEIQKRLKALLDLQTILSTQQLPTDQLSQIRDQLSRIAISVHVPAPTAPQPPPIPAVPPVSSSPALPLGQTTNLAALLSKFSKPQPITNIPAILPNSGPTTSGPKNLFESLLSAGLLKPNGSSQPSSGTKPSTTLDEWIRFREDEDDSTAITTGLNQLSSDLTAAGTTAQEITTQNYIPAPNDPALSNITCPVCKEKFTTVWHPDAEDWVLMDAIKSGGRIYHASCFSEISKEHPSGSATASRGSTPENSISKGKRKADQDLASIINKIKKEK